MSKSFLFFVLVILLGCLAAIEAAKTKTGVTKTGSTRTGSTTKTSTRTGVTKTGSTRTGVTKTGSTKTGRGPKPAKSIKPTREGDLFEVHVGHVFGIDKEWSYMKFIPTELTINVGDKINFTIDGDHSVTFIPDLTNPPPLYAGNNTLAFGPEYFPMGNFSITSNQETISTGVVDEGSFIFSFPRAGTFTAICFIHPYMNFTVKVKAGAPPMGPGQVRNVIAQTKIDAETKAGIFTTQEDLASRFAVNIDRNDGSTHWFIRAGWSDRETRLSFNRFIPSKLTVRVGDLVTFTVNGFEPHTVSFNSSGAFESGNVIINGQESGDPSYLKPYRVTNIRQAVRKLRAQEKKANRNAKRKARRQRRKNRNNLESDVADDGAVHQDIDSSIPAQQHAIEMQSDEVDDYLNDEQFEGEFDEAENEIELEDDSELIEEEVGDEEEDEFDEEDVFDEEDGLDDSVVEADAKKKNKRKTNQRTRAARRRAAARVKRLTRAYNRPYDQGFFGSGLLFPGQTFDVEFAVTNPPGTLKPYICFLHQDMGMVGLITVVGGKRSK